jgi:hypothetical protein
MKPARRALSGSAVGICTVGRAQAADLLTKARPVECLRAPGPCLTSIKSK